MSTFETPPTEIEDDPTSGTQSGSHMEFSEADKEALRKLDSQLNPNKAVEIGMKPEEIAKLHEALKEDTAKLHEALDKSQKNIDTRLADFMKAHPNVKISEVTLGDVYSAQEISVMKAEAEKTKEMTKESWINWGLVWKGTKIVGGVLIAAAIGGVIGYSIYSALMALGYGPAMLSLTEKVLGVAGSALDSVNKGLESAKDGLNAAWENIKSWKVWTNFSSGVDKGTADIAKSATEATKRVAGSTYVPPKILGWNPLPPLK